MVGVGVGNALVLEAVEAQQEAWLGVVQGPWGHWGTPRTMEPQVCTSSWPQFWAGLALPLEAVLSPTGHLILQGKRTGSGPGAVSCDAAEMCTGAGSRGFLQPAHVGPSWAGLLPGRWL